MHLFNVSARGSIVCAVLIGIILAVLEAFVCFLFSFLLQKSYRKAHTVWMEDFFISSSHSLVRIDNPNALYSARDALIGSAFVGFAIGVLVTGLAVSAYKLYIEPLRATRLARVRPARHPRKIHLYYNNLLSFLV